MNRSAVRLISLSSALLIGVLACHRKPAPDEQKAGFFTPVPTVLAGDLSIPNQAQGDVLYFNGTNWVHLAAGTSGQFLETLGAAANPAWATVSGSAPGGSAGGDLSGTFPNPTVAKVNGTAYGAGGSLTTGQIPRVTGASTTAYGALDLANTNAVTGALPFANLATITSVNGTTIAAGGSLTTGNALRASGSGAATWSALNLAGGSGFVTGALPFANMATITGVNGSTIGAGGALSTGAVLRATGAAAADYGAVDLANASAVTGILPSANLFAATTSSAGSVMLAQDLGGTSALPTVLALTGTAGVVTGPSTAITVGSSVASAGALRLGNAMSLTSRNAANSADLNIARSDSSNILTYGGTVNAGLVLNTATGNTIDNQVNSASVGTFSSTGLTVPGNVSVGATPATNSTGINLPNNVFMWGRNAANSVNYSVIGVNASNNVEVGSSSAGGIVFSGSGLGSKTFTIDSAGLRWAPTVAGTVSKIGVDIKLADVAPVDTTVYGQGAYASATTSAATKSGGGVVIQGGVRTSTSGKRGPVRIQINGSSTENMVEVCDVQPEATTVSRVVSLVRPTAISSTEMPTNTGDLVVYVGSAGVIPSASPVSGSILYSNAGVLGCRNSNGGQIEFTATTQTTVGASGGGPSLAVVNPVKMMNVVVGGTTYSIPLYNP